MSTLVDRVKDASASRFAAPLVAAGLTVYAQASLWLGDPPPSRGLAAVLLALVTVPVAWSRLRPLGAACAVAAGLAALGLLLPDGSPEGGFVLFPLLLALYSVGAHEDGRRAAAGLLAVFAGATVNVSSDPDLVTTGDVVVADAFFVFFLGGAAWLLGRDVRRRQAERDQRASEAVAAERARIARELHDVVAHSVSVMGVQAAAAQEVMDREPERARLALGSIQDTARDAVLELRRLLGMMRDADSAVPLAPQPGLAQIGTLVGQVEAAGLAVELMVEGAYEPLPAAIDLSAYRIVQEALTNALKHAHPTVARVTVRYGAADLELIVENDGVGTSDANGAGHGLISMRERAELFGGSLETGSGGTGRYWVRARLPLRRHA
jgi:signal transduction histidine kinase